MLPDILIAGLCPRLPVIRVVVSTRGIIIVVRAVLLGSAVWLHYRAILFDVTIDPLVRTRVRGFRRKTREGCKKYEASKNGTEQLFHSELLSRTLRRKPTLFQP